jgi:hypothetical protein
MGIAHVLLPCAIKKRTAVTLVDPKVAPLPNPG